MLEWLEERLGPSEPLPAPASPSSFLPGPGRALPELPGLVSFDPLDRLTHARGQGLPDLLRLRSGAVPAVPDAVAWPENDAEVEATLARSAAAGVRVVPWGGGTSVTGGVNVLAGEPPTVSLDLSRLAGLADFDAVSGLATFGAGTLGPDLEAALAGQGFTLGHFPQSFELSTLGGWVVTRASGQESLGYGGISERVAGLTLVAPAGRMTLPALPGAASGPDLRQVVVGSEGRLGVVTRVTVRVSRRPEETSVEAWLLHDWPAGLAAARELVQERLPLSMLRLSNPPETEVALAVGLGGHGLAGSLVKTWLRLRRVGRGCLLLLGWHGSLVERERTRDRATDVLRRHRAVGLGTSPGKSWTRDRYRHPYLRDALLDRGIATDTLETAGTWAAVPELARSVTAAIESALSAENEPVASLCHVSHPYPDGSSLYFTFFFRCPGDPEAAIARWATIKRAATDAITAGGGALSHHHGVGRWHAPWLDREVGPRGRAVLEAAARTLDPAGIMSPGVLLDPADRLEG